MQLDRPRRQRIGEKPDRRGVGRAIATPCSLRLARAEGEEEVNAGQFLLSNQRRRRCRQCGARAQLATQSRCCGEGGVVEVDPIARQRPADRSSSMMQELDRCRSIATRQRIGEKPVGAASVGHRHALLAPPRAR